jgi:hypothetical protein
MNDYCVSFEAFTAMMFHVEVFCVVVGEDTSISEVYATSIFRKKSEDGSSMNL